MRGRITICGAGLVGSLLAIYLKRIGFDVRVFEKRPDPRLKKDNAGRSINLAISHRGLRALQEAIPDLDKAALKLSVPMYGREIHDANGERTFQPYGESTQHINAIGRAALNELLISRAEQAGVYFLFDHACIDYNFLTKEWKFSTSANESILTESGEIVIGADGAFSVIRKFLAQQSGVYPLIETLEYGYKELDIDITNVSTLQNKEALHIWPRERFMLIALPNKDDSYTATLFLPMTGELSFEELNSDEKILPFFKTHFSDALQVLPDLCEQFKAHPTSNLFTVNSSDWYNNHTLLIGDAAHALVPFYGQGMNAGFEDCRILAEIIDKHKELNWLQIFSEFFVQRKQNADAISDLALQNFIEMRDHVADSVFLVRKKIEKFLHHTLAEKFIPQYTMVSFSDTPYKEAKEIGELHDTILKEIMSLPGIEDAWPSAELEQYAVKTAEKYL
jgi:kynurenine 3-monooxygenase